MYVKIIRTLEWWNMKLEQGAAKAEYAICLSSPMYFFL